MRRDQDEHKSALLLLNLGCGTRVHPAWVNIDYSPIFRLVQHWLFRPFARVQVLPGYVNHDLRRGIPFKTTVVDVVYSSHFLEHLEHRYAMPFLQEVYRVLKPGGIVRLVVPDLETFASNYLSALAAVRSGDADANDRLEWATLVLLDQMVRTEPGGEMAKWLRLHRQTPWVRTLPGIFSEIADSNAPGEPQKIRSKLASLIRPTHPASTGEVHRWMYDEVSLSQLLECARFKDIMRMSHQTSRIPNWSEYRLDGTPGAAPYQPDSIWMEAVK